MIDVASFAHSAITLFQQHQPWLMDKLGGALATQSVRELWELTKAKLGSGATAKVESKPDDPAQWEVLKAKLLLAMDEDPGFLDKVKKLSESAGGGINQTAIGSDIRQVGVDRSSDVKINVK